MAEERYYQIPVKTRVWCTCVGEHVYSVPAIPAQINTIEELAQLFDDPDHLALEARRVQHGNDLDNHPETLAISQAYVDLGKKVVVKVTTEDHEAYKAAPEMAEAIELTEKQVTSMVAEVTEKKRVAEEARVAAEMERLAELEKLDDAI